MKPAQLQSRLPSPLSDSLHHKLSGYGLAATAAGVSLLALTQSAEAKIIYTKTHKNIGPNNPYKLDLNSDRHTDFVLRQFESGSMGFKEIHLTAKQANGNSVVGSIAENGHGYGFALKPGFPISAKQNFVANKSGESMATVQQSDTVFYKYYGPWNNVANRYLGLRFQIHGKTHYGWARLNVRFEGFAINAVLTGYAYETVPNKPIIAGKPKD